MADYYTISDGFEIAVADGLTNARKKAMNLCKKHSYNGKPLMWQASIFKGLTWKTFADKRRLRIGTIYRTGENSFVWQKNVKNRMDEPICKVNSDGSVTGKYIEWDVWKGLR